MRSSAIAPKTYRNSMLPSRCSQFAWMKSAVSGVSRAPAVPLISSVGTTPQCSKYALWAARRLSPVP